MNCSPRVNDFQPIELKEQFRPIRLILWQAAGKNMYNSYYLIYSIINMLSRKIFNLKDLEIEIIHRRGFLGKSNEQGQLANY